jgi:hypothetical protein
LYGFAPICQDALNHFLSLFYPTFGVLVAISIPIFTSQLEKSRDAVSISNIRAAYAEAASAVLTHTKDTTYPVGNVTSVSEDGKTAVVGNVVIKSQQKNT